MQPEADADHPDTAVADQQAWVLRAGGGAA
jgi:hypothetical protein